MSQFLRTLGVAVLAVASLDASAGLCFCHPGPIEAGSAPASQGCCHGPETSATTAVTAAGSCCHIESAESAAGPVVPVQLAPPAATVTALRDGAPTLRTALFVAATLQGSPPPLFVLRI